MSRRHTGWHIRDIAPSKGERLFKYKHRGHRPANVLTFRSRAVKVVRMFQALAGNGWTFKFKLEAMSPRGWPYWGEGATAEEAFLKAFRAWESDVQTLVPKIPQVMRQAEENRAFMKKYKKTRIKELLLTFGPDVARLSPLGPRVEPSPDPKINQQRTWRRLYMRAYRSNLPRKRAMRPMAVAA